MSFCCWLTPNLETSGRDENLDSITPLETHTRISLRLTQLMTGCLKEGSWRRMGSKGEWHYVNQDSDIILVTARKYFLETQHRVMVQKTYFTYNNLRYLCMYKCIASINV